MMVNMTPENLIKSVNRVRTDDQREFCRRRWGVVPNGIATHTDGRQVRVDRVYVARTEGGELHATATGRVVEEADLGERYGSRVFWSLPVATN